jgi:hypothetical protein
MPAAGVVVGEYASYYAFAFNLNIACPVFECAPETVVTGPTPILRRGLNALPHAVQIRIHTMTAAM